MAQLAAPFLLLGNFLNCSTLFEEDYGGTRL